MGAVATEYYARRNYSKKDAELIQHELNKLYKQWGQLPPERVVDTARDDTHPLHRFFEWDPHKAHEKYLLVQAREMIRSVRVTIIEDDEEKEDIRAWSPGIKVIGEDVVRGYLPTTEALSDKDQSKLLIAAALRDLEAWRAKHESYMKLVRGLRPLLEAVRKLEAALRKRAR